MKRKQCICGVEIHGQATKCKSCAAASTGRRRDYSQAQLRHARAMTQGVEAEGIGMAVREILKPMGAWE
jgi:hypothetical protein